MLYRTTPGLTVELGVQIVRVGADDADVDELAGRGVAIVYVHYAVDLGYVRAAAPGSSNPARHISQTFHSHGHFRRRLTLIPKPPRRQIKKPIDR